jgi:hypothetical protein
MLREQLEDTPAADTDNIKKQLAVYREQLKKYD